MSLHIFLAYNFVHEVMHIAHEYSCVFEESMWMDSPNPETDSFPNWQASYSRQACMPRCAVFVSLGYKYSGLAPSLYLSFPEPTSAEQRLSLPKTPIFP